MALDGSTNRPRILRTQGRTPAADEHQSVIFFANLLSLFFGNQGGAQRLQDEISCVDTYGGRLLPLIGLLHGKGDHILVLERTPDAALMKFFEEIGLELPKIELMKRQEYLELGAALEKNSDTSHPLLDRLRRESAGVIDGFVTDETLERIATAIGKRTLSTTEGSHRGNNKLLLHQFVERSGLPTPPTHLAKDSGEVMTALAALAEEGYAHAVIKAQVGASGIGLLKVATNDTDIHVPDSFFHEGAGMVQAWLEPGTLNIEAIHSPSVQIFLNQDSIHLYDLTEQILDPVDSVHQGNESPPPYLDDFEGLTEELMSQAGEAATWLHQQGYRGPASVDFLATRDKDRQTTVYICEINARVTGATYPSVLARHFHPHGAWRMRNLELKQSMPGEELLESLQRHGELFDPQNRNGILPINFNLDPDRRVRKGQFLAIGEDSEQCLHLLDAARADLPVKWDYTHDR